MTESNVAQSLERIVYAAVAITAAAQRQATHGRELAFTQWRALNVVGECEDGCRIGEVAARVRVTLPATSRLLRRLEKRGLLSLEPDERDGRATLVRLTTEGAAVRKAVLGYRREQVALVVGAVDVTGPGDQVLADLAAAFAARGW
jgi:DNA-binding MarR family transcriptional regulator